MKYFLPLLLLLTHLAVAQTSKSQIEIMPFVRHDLYPKFSYHYQDRVYKDNLSMQGISWGTNITYKYLLGNNFWIKAGVGYYRYSFNHIDNNNRWGQSKFIPINYPSNFEIGYATDKYWYNSISFNIGLEKSIPLNRSLHFISGLNVSDFYTYSRIYHVSSNIGNYKLNKKQNFGYSGHLNFGLVKSIQNYSFFPTLLIAVFDSWQHDQIFGANQNKNLNKWFKGLGLGISMSRNL